MSNSGIFVARASTAEESVSLKLKDLRDITECPMCLELYSNPRVLPCVHTFCLKCIECFARQNQTAGLSVSCPLCRKYVTAGTIDELPKNYFVQKLLDVFCMYVPVHAVNVPIGRLCQWHVRANVNSSSHFNDTVRLNCLHKLFSTKQLIFVVL